MFQVVTDYRFNYALLGNLQKPIILFLHGFMGSWQDFAEVANLLKDDFCCLTIDLPAHGKTRVDKDSNYQMSEVAEGIIELLDTLKIKQCFLVGYSMGGRLALYLTVYFSQYFVKIILESASPGLATKTERDNRIKQDLLLAKKLETEDFCLFLQRWYTNPLFASFIKHPGYHKAIAKKLNNDPFKLSKSLKYMGLGAQPSLWSYLPDNRIGLLLVVGELDPKFIAINQKIDFLSPQSELKIVKNTDHNVHYEQPIEFARLINNFFGNRDRT